MKIVFKVIKLNTYTWIHKQNLSTFNFIFPGNAWGSSSHVYVSTTLIRSSDLSGIRFFSILGGCVILCRPLKILFSKSSTEFSWLSDQLNLEPGGKFDEKFLLEKLGLSFATVWNFLMRGICLKMLMNSIGYRAT